MAEARPASCEVGREPPRFPWLQAVFCAACVAAAAWTWMRYSYAWDIGESHPHYWIENGSYVSVPEEGGDFLVYEPGRRPPQQVSRNDRRVVALAPAGADVIKGRMTDYHYPFESRECQTVAMYLCDMSVLDATASRFTGASIAGLAVGVMGVLVFALHLGQWARERRAARSGKLAAPS